MKKSHALKSIALIVGVVTVIILLHNLYLYEIDYGIPITYSTEKTVQPSTLEPEQGKEIAAVTIVLNLISLGGILGNYFSQDQADRKFEFDPMELRGAFIGVVMLITYIVDALMVIGLLSYLLYLIL